MKTYKLIGNVCVKCRHLHIETDNPLLKICECNQPLLAPAKLVHKMSIKDIPKSMRLN